jgi:hypothetical protein
MVPAKTTVGLLVLGIAWTALLWQVTDGNMGQDGDGDVDLADFEAIISTCVDKVGDDDGKAGVSDFTTILCYVVLIWATSTYVYSEWLRYTPHAAELAIRDHPWAAQCVPLEENPIDPRGPWCLG